MSFFHNTNRVLGKQVTLNRNTGGSYRSAPLCWIQAQGWFYRLIPWHEWSLVRPRNKQECSQHSWWLTRLWKLRHWHKRTNARSRVFCCIYTCDDHIKPHLRSRLHFLACVLFSLRQSQALPPCHIVATSMESIILCEAERRFFVITSNWRAFLAPWCFDWSWTTVEWLMSSVMAGGLLSNGWFTSLKLACIRSHRLQERE